jgi:hypothetical protein
MVEGGSNEMYSTGKLAKALGISTGKVKKLLASLELEPDAVKGNCKYYSSEALGKLEQSLENG